MRRREFVGLLGSAAMALPLAASAQQADRMRRIGVLLGAAEDDPVGQTRNAAFRQALQALGWTEGRNLHIEWRWTGGDIVRTRQYAMELVRLAPDLIVTTGTPAIAAVKRATQSIPVVFTIVNDPVAQGFISSVAHPGGNITGFTFLEYSVIGKQLELLKQMAPSIVRVAILFNPDTYPYYNTFLSSFEATSRTLSIEVVGAPRRAPEEIQEEVAELSKRPGSGLLVAPDPFTVAHRALIMKSADQNRIPAMYSFRQFIQEGGLMSYGADTIDIMRRSANYVDRILRGANPGELPVQQPTKYEFAINLKTVKALGLNVSPMLLAIADEVIE